MADQKIRTYTFGWKVKAILNEIYRQAGRREKRRERPRKIRYEGKEIARNEYIYILCRKEI
jgi:hypothetical protein